MQEEWYVPSPRTKRRTAAFFATPEGKKALQRYERIIYSGSPKKPSYAAPDYGKEQAKRPHK